MELLQVVHDHAERVNAFEGLTFNLGNIITLVGLIFGGVRLWMKIVSNQQSSDNAINSLQIDLQKSELLRIKAEELIASDIKAASHGRIALKKELRFEISKEHEVFTKRIDKTQSDLKEHKADSDGEFKQLTALMNTVNGKLDILIQKK